MKEAFKKSFGTILGFWCGCMLVKIISDLTESNKKKVNNTTTEESDFVEEH